MFHSIAPKPTPTKHVIYLFASTGLGVLLGFLAHAGMEIWYLRWADTNGTAITWYNGCALHPAIQIALPVLGALGGFFLGRWWWRMVYIEQRWAKKP